MDPCEVAERYLDSSRGNAGVNGERIRAAGAPGASWNGWTLPDWKPRQKPITAMAGGS
jgi:hypothetical protein